MSNPNAKPGSGSPLLQNSPPQTGQISVDQQRNEVLAKISQALGNLLGVGFGTTPVTASPYAVKTSDRILEVNASAGNVIVVYPPSLMVGVEVRVAKVDGTGNSVIISPDGVATAASFNTAASGSVVASKVVWSNGSVLRVS